MKILFCFVALAASSFAAPTAGPAAAVERLCARKLTLCHEEDMPQIARPPALTQQEADSILALQGKRTVSDALTTARETTTAASTLLQIAGVDRIKHPQTFTLAIMLLSDSTVLGAKELLRWRVPTPSGFTPNITPITPELIALGYPSLHALNMRVALRLVEACQGQENAAGRQYCRAVASRRIRGGMEWPTAVRDAETLADAYVEALVTKPYFAGRFRLAQGEWK